MPVYMIRCGENGPVKIGHTNDITKRLYELQVAHWEILRVLRLFEGAALEETRLHARFLDLYIRGEWHSFSRRMLGDVGLLEIVAPVVEAPPAVIPATATAAVMGERIAALRRTRGLTQGELSVGVGMSRSTLASIEAGHDLPGRETLFRLCKFFGVPFIEVAA